MTLLEENIYNEAIQLKRGNKIPNKLLVAFQKWAKFEYDIDVVTFVYGMKEVDHKKSLNIILFTGNDIEKLRNEMNKDFGVCNQIVKKFKEFYNLFKHANLKEEDAITLYFTNLSQEIRNHIMKQAGEELRKVKDLLGYEAIKKVYIEFDEIHIFYNKDSDIEENDKNGLSQKINEYCKNIINKYDEFHVFDDSFQCIFVSEEILSQNFRENLFQYSKERT